MPTYVYECPICHTRFEKFQHIGQNGPVMCPEGHQGARRIYVPVGIVFKGSGFYTTDNRQGGKDD